MKWADEVGQDLKGVRICLRDSKANYRRGLKSPGEDGVSLEHGEGKVEQPTIKSRQVDQYLGKKKFGGCDQLGLGQYTYKEVLLMRQQKQPSKNSTSTLGRSSFSSKGKTPVKLKKAGGCFRCLAADHCVADCRDPVRCLTYWTSSELVQVDRSQGGGDEEHEYEQRSSSTWEGYELEGVHPLYEGIS